MCESESPTKVKDLLRALEGVDPETPLLVQWGPGTEVCSQAGGMLINTYDVDEHQFYVEGEDEPVPPKESRTVQVFIIVPGYGGLPE